MKISNKLKAVVGGVALAGAALTTAFADNVFDLSEGQHLLAVLLEVGVGIWAVWRVPNKQVPTE